MAEPNKKKVVPAEHFSALTQNTNVKYTFMKMM